MEQRRRDVVGGERHPHPGVAELAEGHDRVLGVGADAAAVNLSLLRDMAVGVGRDDEPEIANAVHVVVAQHADVLEHPPAIPDRGDRVDLGVEVEQPGLDAAHAHVVARGRDQRVAELLARKSGIVREAGPAGVRPRARAYEVVGRDAGLREHARHA